MDMIALNGSEEAMPSPGRTVDDLGMFGIGTMQDNSHENGLNKGQTGIQTTNPSMVAAANVVGEEKINNGGPSGSAAALVTAKSANNDPGQTIEAGMQPENGQRGGPSDNEVAAPAPNWKKWALVAGAAAAFIYFKNR